MPVFALLDLMSSFYSDDFALKNRRALQYVSHRPLRQRVVIFARRFTVGLALMRKYTKFSHLFRDIELRLPLLSPLRLIPITFAAVIVLFLLLDPNDYFSIRCRVRPELINIYDRNQLIFSSILVGVVMFGLSLSFFNQATTIVRLCVYLFLPPKQDCSCCASSRQTRL